MNAVDSPMSQSPTAALAQLQGAVVNALMPLLPPAADSAALSALVATVHNVECLQRVLDASADGHAPSDELLFAMLSVLVEASSLNSPQDQQAPPPPVSAPPQSHPAPAPWPPGSDDQGLFGENTSFSNGMNPLAPHGSDAGSQVAWDPSVAGGKSLTAPPWLQSATLAAAAAAAQPLPQFTSMASHHLGTTPPTAMLSQPLQRHSCMPAYSLAPAAPPAGRSRSRAVGAAAGLREPRAPFWCPITGSQLSNDRAASVQAAADPAAPLIAALLPWPRDIKDLFNAAHLLLHLDTTATEQRSAGGPPLPTVVLSTALTPPDVQQRVMGGDMRRSRLWTLRSSLPDVYAAPAAWKDDNSPVTMGDLHGLRLILRSADYAVAPTMHCALFLCHEAMQHALAKSSADAAVAPASLPPQTSSSSSAPSSSSAMTWPQVVAPYVMPPAAPLTTYSATSPLPAPPTGIALQPRMTALQRLNTFKQRENVQTTWLDRQAASGLWASQLFVDGILAAKSPQWYTTKRQAREAAAAMLLPPTMPAAAQPPGGGNNGRRRASMRNGSGSGGSGSSNRIAAPARGGMMAGNVRSRSSLDW